MMLQAIGNELKNERILILGFGREGRSTWRMLRQILPTLPLAVADRQPVHLPWPDAHTIVHSGGDYLAQLDTYSLVIKTPGISLLAAGVTTATPITCQTDLFLRHAPCLTIGITGTKGKSTTASLIHHLLQTAGRDALLMGNIGVPVFDRVADVTPDTIAVIELSSHQLEYTRGAPDIAVLTNLYPEHLDHYASYAHYIAAKMNILRYQSADDLGIYMADHAELQAHVQQTARGRLLPITATTAMPDGLRAAIRHNPRLAGRHNLCNAQLASAACRAVGVPEAAIATGLATYAGMPHRMEPLGTFAGIRFVDNAIATVPIATLLALETLGHVDTLIVGGLDRGVDLLPFVDALAAADVDTVVCMPDTGRTIRARLTEIGAPQRALWADDLATAVALCYQHTPVGGVCLLSPTASSYNQFKDFEEKGRRFQQLVRTHNKEVPHENR